MKKSLARAICLTLFCSAFAATDAHALEVTGDITLTSDLTEGIVISGSSPININVAGSGDGLQVVNPDGYGIINQAVNTTFTGKKFWLTEGRSNGIRNTNGSRLTFDNDISVGIHDTVGINEIENEGELTINGNYYGWRSYIEGAAGIVNSGSFKFNGEEFQTRGTINNSTGGEMLFNGRLASAYGIENQGNITFDGVDNLVYISGNITNQGKINFNGKEFGTGRASIKNLAGGEMLFNGGRVYVSEIENQGKINFNGEGFSTGGASIKNLAGGEMLFNGEWVYVSGIENQGKINFNGPTTFWVNSGSGVVNDAGGEIEFNSAIYIVGDIENRGRLSINYKNKPAVSDNITISQGIQGNIKHFEGAQTDIVLSGYMEPDGSVGYPSYLDGNIIGSNSDFHLTLENLGYWHPYKQEGAVEGVTLNGGEIVLNENNFVHYTADNGEMIPYPWSDDYDSLTLKNFKSNGQGWLELSTDLKNNVGDQYNFVGTTPTETLNLVIINKDDNGGVPIKKEDGHSVTVVTAPSDTGMKFDAVLGIYDKYDVAYYPIIEEVTADNLKKWNFVGWDKGDKKDVLPQNEDGHEINGVDIDNTLKRLNDIRTDPSEVGVWIRGEKGDSQIRNYKYSYDLMSGGYDWYHENDARKLFYGLGISYTTNSCDDNVVGDTKSLGYNIYGSWVGKKNNDYVDLILKYGGLDKEYAGIDNNNVFVKGEYDKNLFAIALKYGRRIFLKDSFYYEPQIGYTYGHVGSADYTDNWGSRIHADSSTSHIGSLGVQVGKDIKGTEIYGRVAYIYDFDGKMHVGTADTYVEDDMGGGYMQVAIGAARKVDSNNSFYIDLGKDFGNKVKKPYSVSVGYRHTF